MGCNFTLGRYVGVITTCLAAANRRTIVCDVLQRSLEWCVCVCVCVCECCGRLTRLASPQDDGVDQAPVVDGGGYNSAPAFGQQAQQVRSLFHPLPYANRRACVCMYCCVCADVSDHNLTKTQSHHGMATVWAAGAHHPAIWPGWRWMGCICGRVRSGEPRPRVVLWLDGWWW
jgi:hypothetical protein